MVFRPPEYGALINPMINAFDGPSLLDFWRSRNHFQELPGPRDWSPAIGRAKEELKALQTRVPEQNQVPLRDALKFNVLEVVEAIEKGFAFIVYLESMLEVVFVTTKGTLSMTKKVGKLLGGKEA